MALDKHFVRGTVALCGACFIVRLQDMKSIGSISDNLHAGRIRSKQQLSKDPWD